MKKPTLPSVTHLRVFALAVIIGAGLAVTGASALGQSVVWPNGLLTQAGITNFPAKESNPGWRSNSFSCPSGYQLVSYHFDEFSSNNADWRACVPVSGNVRSYPSGVLSQAGITNMSWKESNPGWTWNQFSCDSGYVLQGYHYDHHASNNSIWYTCVQSGTVPNPTPQPPVAPTDPDDYADDYDDGTGNSWRLQRDGRGLESNGLTI